MSKWVVSVLSAGHPSLCGGGDDRGNFFLSRQHLRARKSKSLSNKNKSKEPIRTFRTQGDHVLPANHLAHCALPANALIIHKTKQMGRSLTHYLYILRKKGGKKKKKKKEDCEQNNLISNLTFLEMQKKKKKKFYISWLDWLDSQNKSWVRFSDKRQSQ